MHNLIHVMGMLKVREMCSKVMEYGHSCLAAHSFSEHIYWTSHCVLGVVLGRGYQFEIDKQCPPV